MNLEIEDGSLLVPARLGTQFMREFFGALLRCAVVHCGVLWCAGPPLAADAFRTCAQRGLGMESPVTPLQALLLFCMRRCPACLLSYHLMAALPIGALLQIPPLQQCPLLGFRPAPADVEPQEFQALLADPTRKLEGVELAKGLQKLLSSYSGLIEGGRQRWLHVGVSSLCHGSHSGRGVRAQTASCLYSAAGAAGAARGQKAAPRQVDGGRCQTAHISVPSRGNQPPAPLLQWSSRRRGGHCLCATLGRSCGERRWRRCSGAPPADDAPAIWEGFDLLAASL